MLVSYDDAFQQGYRDCQESTSSSAATSFSSSLFNPPEGFREPQQGWNKAAEDTAARLSRSERRRDIIGPLLLGVLLLGGGSAIMYLSVNSRGSHIIAATGLIISGGDSLLKGVVFIFKRPAAE